MGEEEEKRALTHRKRLKGIKGENYRLFVWLSAIYSTIMAKLPTFTGSSIICRKSFVFHRYGRCDLSSTSLHFNLFIHLIFFCYAIAQH